MPRKNRVKEYLPNSEYHAYNRGVNGCPIFIDRHDRAYFYGLFDRYLSPGVKRDKCRRQYKTLFGRLALLSFCLMSNHFHLVLRQFDDPRAIEEFMRKLTTAYTMYFNKRHGRFGHLFEDDYKAPRALDDAHLRTQIVYAHLNPDHPFEYEDSSHRYYIGEPRPPWLRSDLGLDGFGGRSYYLRTVAEELASRQRRSAIDALSENGGGPQASNSSGANSANSDTGRPTTLR